MSKRCDVKLICWNCNCALRKKYKLIAGYRPDILICPESESPEQLNHFNEKITCTSHVWIGERCTKGLSVLTFNGYSAEIAPFHNPDFQYILPIIITTPQKQTFLLLAVWTKATAHVSRGYIVQACMAMQYYRPWFDENTIIAGDFNSNKLWDHNTRRRYNHSKLLELLARDHFTSLYHYCYREFQGAETQPTMFLHKNAFRPYHIDYVFINTSKLFLVRDFAVGEYRDWISASDHMPLLMEMREVFPKYYSQQISA